MNRTKYFSTRTFGGHMAKVGMVVIVATPCAWPVGVSVRAGLIDVILEDDTIGIQAIGEKSTWDGYRAPSTSLSFVETKTMEDIEAMPSGSWTWPV